MEETEYKFMVSKDIFDKTLEIIKNKYPAVTPYDRVQINYYYDTDDGYLRSNYTTLRVRQIEDKLSMEIKESMPTLSEYSTSKETIKKIETLPADITLQEGKFAWIPFSLQGDLVTRRVSIKPSESLLIDFDINCYFGKCDYEIEMEFDESSKKATMILIKSLGLMQYKNEIGGKSTRFYKMKSEKFKGYSYE